MESLGSGFAIHLQVGLSDEEEEMFLGALGEDRMADPILEMEGDPGVVDVEFELLSAIGSNGQSRILFKDHQS